MARHPSQWQGSHGVKLGSSSALNSSWTGITQDLCCHCSFPQKGNNVADARLQVPLRRPTFLDPFIGLPLACSTRKSTQQEAFLQLCKVSINIHILVFICFSTWKATVRTVLWICKATVTLIHPILNLPGSQIKTWLFHSASFVNVPCVACESHGAPWS